MLHSLSGFLSSPVSVVLLVAVAIWAVIGIVRFLFRAAIKIAIIAAVVAVAVGAGFISLNSLPNLSGVSKTISSTASKVQSAEKTGKAILSNPIVKQLSQSNGNSKN